MAAVYWQYTSWLSNDCCYTNLYGSSLLTMYTMVFSWFMLHYISMEADYSQCTPWFSRDCCYTTSLWKQFIHNVHHCFLMSVVTLHFNQWKKQISHNGHHSFLLVVVSLHLYGSRLFTMHTMSFAVDTSRLLWHKTIMFMRARTMYFNHSLLVATITTSRFRPHDKSLLNRLLLFSNLLSPRCVLSKILKLVFKMLLYPNSPPNCLCKWVLQRKWERERVCLPAHILIGNALTKHNKDSFINSWDQCANNIAWPTMWVCVQLITHRRMLSKSKFNRKM